MGRGKTRSTKKNPQFLDWSKFKAIADDKKECNLKNGNYYWNWHKNIVGKGENAGYQHFLLFPQCFQKVSFSGSL